MMSYGTARKNGRIIPAVAKRTSKRRDESDTDAPRRDVLPLPEKEEVGSLDYFLQEIEDAEDRLKKHVREWKRDQSRYDGEKGDLHGFKSKDVINVNVQFYTVEQKKPQLIFQTPFIHVEPDSEQREVVEAAPIFQAVLNKLLGRNFIDADTLLDEVLHDNLVTAGFSPTKIGYDVAFKTSTQPTGRMVPDPSGAIVDVLDPNGMVVDRAPKMVLATDERGRPETETVKVPIWSEYYWRRFSPADLRLPKGFTAIHRTDEAPWIGWRVPYPDKDGKGASHLDADLSLLTSEDREAYDRVGFAYELWYRAHLFDKSAVHPEKIRQLVIVPESKRGRNKFDARVLIHRDSPYQQFSETGELIGMKGYPIHILTTRVRPDRFSPKSDCAVLRDVADEKSMGRSTMVQQRKRNLPLRAVDKNRMKAEDVKRLETGEVQSLIAVDGPVHEIIAAVDRAALPQENFEFDRIAQQDVDRLAASGANQQGIQTDNVSTATEASLIQRASDTRQAKERNRLMNCYLAAIEKIGSLVQLFADETQIIKLEDEQGTAQYLEWDKTKIQGRFAFTLKPDSAVRINAAEDRAEFLKLFNLVVNYEGANREELFRTLIAKHGLSPSKFIMPPADRAQPQPEKPKVSISIKGDDLDPLAPQYANVKAILEASGLMELQPAAPPQPLEAGQPGTPVNKHASDLTGQRSGPPVPGQTQAPTGPSPSVQ